jgi:hypothetical protein
MGPIFGAESVYIFERVEKEEVSWFLQILVICLQAQWLSFKVLFLSET